MKKKQYLNITISFMLVVLLIVATSYSASLFLSNQIEKMEDIPTSFESIVASNFEKTKIEKTETKDYFYYKVEDYERNLSYSWKFLKEEDKNISVEDSLFITEDLRLSLDKTSEDVKTIHDRVNQDKLIISFDYHGSLPLETTVRINVADRFKNGEKLYLYYYNPEEDNIEYIMHNVEVKDGYIEFQIEHCSDYFLTAAVVNDAVNNPKSVNFIIIGLIVIVFILIAVTLLQSKK